MQAIRIWTDPNRHLLHRSQLAPVAATPRFPPNRGMTRGLAKENSSVVQRMIICDGAGRAHVDGPAGQPWLYWRLRTTTFIQQSSLGPARCGAVHASCVRTCAKRGLEDPLHDLLAKSVNSSASTKQSEPREQGPDPSSGTVSSLEPHLLRRRDQAPVFVRVNELASFRSQTNAPMTLRPMRQVNVRPALASEREVLEALQWRASLSNPGDRKALLANPGAIELPLEQIESGGVFVAEVDGMLKGFAAILPREDGDSELDALFVEPEAWRQGIGRALVEHCCLAARSAGAASLHVVGNPHAECFYEVCGFALLGTQQMQFGVGLLMKRALI